MDCNVYLFILIASIFKDYYYAESDDDLDDVSKEQIGQLYCWDVLKQYTR